jgi:hypothetical protein
MHSGLEDVGLYESSGRGTRDPPTQVPTQIVRVQLVRLPKRSSRFEISLIPCESVSRTTGTDPWRLSDHPWSAFRV